jgi:hypothetical protein
MKSKLFLFAFLAMFACTNPNKNQMVKLPDASAFRDTIDSKPTGLYILGNKNGM